MTHPTLAVIQMCRIWYEERAAWRGAVFVVLSDPETDEKPDALIVVHCNGNRTLRTFMHDDREPRSAPARALDAIQTLQRLECA